MCTDVTFIRNRGACGGNEGGMVWESAGREFKRASESFKTADSGGNSSAVA